MTNGTQTQESELLSLFSVRHGHFRFESGHHGNRWLELERLLLRPERVRKFAVELAARIRVCEPDAICGPLVEGAFVGLMVAEELKIDFVYSERFERADRHNLFPVDYRIPPALRGTLAGRRVAIVNDVINAGSAVGGSLTDLAACGAIPVGIAALLVLGPAARRQASDSGVPLEAIASLPNEIWDPLHCPLCSARIPLEDPGTRSTPGSIDHERMLSSPMRIELATIRDAPGVMAIISRCLADMRAQSIQQWDEVYPNLEVVEKDAMTQSLFVMRAGSCCIAAICLNEIQPEQYALLPWRCASGRALVIHRLCVDPARQQRGAARALMDFAEEFARGHGFASIRLDAYTGNPRALALYERRGYRRVGQAMFPRRPLPFACFEKSVAPAATPPGPA